MGNYWLILFAATVLTLDIHGVYGGCDDADFITFSGKHCAEYIAEDPCNCKRPHTEVDVKEVCCASCKTANTRFTNDCCKDRITPGKPLNIGGGRTLKSCDMVKSPYQTLCRNELLSSELGLCCETCSMFDLDCLNEMVTFNSMYNCQEFVSMDRCNCARTIGDVVVVESCCDACNGVDTSGCDCMDNLESLEFTVKHPDGTEDIHKFTACSKVVKKFPHLCNTLPEENCCESCKGVCEDNPFFITKVKNKKTGKKCKGCSCQKIRDFDKKTAKKACKKMGKKKVGTNCCAMCSEFK